MKGSSYCSKAWVRCSFVPCSGIPLGSVRDDTVYGHSIGQGCHCNSPYTHRSAFLLLAADSETVFFCLAKEDVFLNNHTSSTLCLCNLSTYR